MKGLEIWKAIMKDNPAYTKNFCSIYTTKYIFT